MSPADAPTQKSYSGVTALVLLGIMALFAVLGWRAVSSPLPGSGDEDTEVAPACDPGIQRGDRVRPRDVVVSVYNAGSRAGLADQTLQELTARNFIEGQAGNAPGPLSQVRWVRVLAPSKDDPAANLVALQFGPATLVAVAKKDLGPGVDLVVGDDFEGLAEAPRRLRAKAPGSGC